MAQPPAFAQRADQGAAGVIGSRGMRSGQGVTSPLLEGARQRAVRIREERPLHIVGVAHVAMSFLFAFPRVGVAHAAGSYLVAFRIVGVAPAVVSLPSHLQTPARGVRQMLRRRG